MFQIPRRKHKSDWLIAHPLDQLLEARRPFIELSEIVTQEEGGILTAWAWWVVPGTPIEGSGLIKVGPNGVLSERLTFYTKLPEA